MRKFFLLALISMALACAKENSNEFVPYPNHELNDTNWHNPVPQAARVRQLDSIFALPVLKDSVDVTAGGSIKFNDSLIITFPPSFCNGSGGATLPSHAKVQVEVITLKTKGDIVRADKPTMSYDQLLVTGGAVNIRVTYNGQPVGMAPNAKIAVKMSTRMSNTNPSNDMRIFYGKEDAFPATSVQPFTWIPAQDTTANSVTVYQDTMGLKGYSFFASRFGWVNCDYFSDTSQPRTKAIVTLPPNYTNVNTNVYAVFNSPDIVAQLYPEPSTKTFVIPNIYVGKVVTFVTLTYLDDKLYLGTKQVTITPNMTIPMVPEQKTKQQITAFLETL
ncbi:MAG TPA: hypothetical protein VF145_07615 [Chitinophagaceae bacterium]